MSTSDDLKTAFAGESQANQKYLAYADKAGRDGFPMIGRLFRAIAAAETVHARNHFRAMDAVKSTLDNLTDARNGEHYEFTEMYPPMVAEAETEGNKRAARSMHGAMEVEKIHYELYGKAIEAANAGRDLPDLKVRICPVCGHTIVGDAPDKCPICGCPGAKYVEIS